MKIVSLSARSLFVVVVAAAVVGILLLSNVDANPDETNLANTFFEMELCGGGTTECLNPIIGEPPSGICEPDCYCIPDRLPCDVCPLVGNRVFAESLQANGATFFNSLEVENDNTLFTFSPIGGCQPYPIVAQFLEQPICDGLIQQESSSSDGNQMGRKLKKRKNNDNVPVPVQYQCSFDYEEEICESKKYNLVQEIIGGRPLKTNKKKKKNKNENVMNDNDNTLFGTHEGTCGVCSTSKDLAVNLSPTLDQDAFTCTSNAAVAFGLPQNIPSVFPNLIECFLNIGFTLDCATIWASNGLNTLLTTLQILQLLQVGSPLPPGTPESCIECATTCAINPESNPGCGLPISPGTCLLTPCFSCDEDASGAIFKQFSGRTRRNSGIITTVQNDFFEGDGPPSFPFVGTKRECSTISNIKQPSRTCERI
jgi:hypothetical protein